MGGLVCGVGGRCLICRFLVGVKSGEEFFLEG